MISFIVGISCSSTPLLSGKSTGKWRYGIFMGYGVNNDFGKTLEAGSTVYGRGFEIESMWRVQPRIAFYPREKFGLFFEVEHTNVNYGAWDGAKNEYVPDHQVANTRFILSAIYNF